MKILELADLHINPKWLDAQKPVLQTVIDTGKQETPDFFCIAGDVYDRPFYNSDKDCIGYVRSFIRSLLNIAPVVMITGTPSHDAPGSYGIFEEMGCHVLHPAQPKIIQGCLFIGLPEITKQFFISKYKKNDMSNINEMMKKEIQSFITSYWMPVRQENKNIPCIFLGHGVFADNPNDENPIIKNTDIVIDNNILNYIQANRYIFGHIHTPIQSEVLNGGYVGYAGFDRSPWNYTGFQPGFNVTEILSWQKGKSFNVSTKRIPYPVVRKEKIKCTLNEIPDLSKYKGCDVRLNVKISKKDLIIQNISELSKQLAQAFNFNSCEIIPDIIKEESQRITKEQAEKLNTLWEKYCFFKGWEKDDNKNVKLKIDEIEKNCLCYTAKGQKKTVSLLYTEIYNSIFSKRAQGKNCFSYDFSGKPTGLTLIKGDNGKGKSIFFGFTSPYPMFIGWDYRTLKDFFPEGGHIIKQFKVNDKIHEHVIKISGSKSKKIECFFCPDLLCEPGINKQYSLKDFMAFCEDIYGPVSSFITTSFFAQEPWKMKNHVSSLVSVNQTQLRNAYLEIAGISREKEKDYANEKIKDIKAKIHDLELKKNTLSEIIADKNSVEKERDRLKVVLNKLDSELGVLVYDENKKQKEFDETKNMYKEQQKINMDIHNLTNHLSSLNNDELVNLEKIKQLEKINIEELRQRIEDNKKIKKSIELLRNDWKILNEKKSEIQKSIDKNEKELRKKDWDGCDTNNTIITNRINKQKYESENEILNKPCFYCKKIPHPENEKRINDNKKIIKEIFNKNVKLILKHKKLEKSIELLKNKIKELKQKLPDEELKHLESQAEVLKNELSNETEISEINKAINEYAKISVYKENLEKIKTNINTTNSQLKTLKEKQNPFIEIKYDKLESELNQIKKEIQSKSQEQTKTKTLLQEIKKQITKIYQHEDEINAILKNLDILVIDLEDWVTIEKDMSPHKLPALELQIIAEEIDYQANEVLAGKFILRTETQYVNKKGEIIDRFKILAYNPITGVEDSILNFSPGERTAYFLQPLSQALMRKRNEKENIEFMWSIADETDNPVKYIHVRDYYEIMNQGLPQGHTRFIMSQKSEIYMYMKNTIDIEEVGKDI